ncbi:MAG: hypothetical protein U0165_12820 [Polyangiaceae bacterium]
MTEPETRDGVRIPPFAQKFPRDPALDKLVSAFANGDFATVREQAPELAKSASDPEVARAALDLRRRLDPDPLAVWMLSGTGLLLLFLIAWFYGHKH